MNDAKRPCPTARGVAAAIDFIEGTWGDDYDEGYMATSAIRQRLAALDAVARHAAALRKVQLDCGVNLIGIEEDAATRLDAALAKAGERP